MYLLIALGCNQVYQIPSCDKVAITSPNYPAPYANNANCLWTFTASSNTQIRVVFSTFDIEDEHDFVKVGNTVTPLSTNEIVTLTGGTVPSAFVSAGNQLWMTFTTDSNKVENGFYVEIQDTCYGN